MGILYELLIVLGIVFALILLWALQEYAEVMLFKTERAGLSSLFLR